MAQVQHWIPMLVYLVEHVVAEQLDDVSVACLRPASISSKLGALVDEAKLAHESEETGVLEFAKEFSFEDVSGPIQGSERIITMKEEDKHESFIMFLKNPWTYHLQNLVDRLRGERHANSSSESITTHLWYFATQKQCKSLNIDTVDLLHHLQALLHIRLVGPRQVVGAEGEYQSTKLNKVILLEHRDVLLRGAEEEDVKNTT